MILVTGGAGFIGSNFILDWLANTDEAVLNLDKLTYAGNLQSLRSIESDNRYVFVHGDIGDEQLVGKLLQQHQPSAIVNFAAESHVDRSIDSPAVFVDTNVVGTTSLLQAATQYWKTLGPDETAMFRFLHVSTDEVFGSLEPHEPAFSETSNYKPNSAYSASKAASDHFVRAWHHTFGLPVLTTHCSNNYGPYQFPEKLIPVVINNALAGNPLPVYGDGKQIRDWLYVGDHCAAIRLVLANGRVGDTYTIGGSNEKENIYIVKLICSLLDDLQANSAGQPYAEQIAYVEDRLGHDRRYAINSTKIRTELGWAPAESFESGIDKTVRWYLSNVDWTDNIVNGQHQTHE